MPSARHLLIPLAASRSPGCEQTLAQLQLPRLDRLLSRLNPTETDTGEETDFAPPHERARARALGLPTRATPWAAWEQKITGTACAWLTPCHWQIGADHMTLLHPEQLGLTEADSRTLVEIIAPWFAQDGLALRYVAPTRWLAQGPLFAELQCAPLDRVMGRDVRPWMPRGQHGTLVQRLHSEVQMLLYTHPWCEERAERGLLPMNAFWIHGAGTLQTLPDPAREPEMPMALYEAALRQDWPAWAQAWQALDGGAVADLLEHLRQGGEVELTLCGERSSLRFSSAQRSLGDKITSIFRRKRFVDLREQL